MRHQALDVAGTENPAVRRTRTVSVATVGQGSTSGLWGCDGSDDDAPRAAPSRLSLRACGTRDSSETV